MDTYVVDAAVVNVGSEDAEAVLLALPQAESPRVQDKLVYVHLLQSTAGLSDRREYRALYSGGLDTYQMLSIRNHLVYGLARLQPEVDTLIAGWSADVPPTLPEKRFFACWLDVATRLTNVPSRNQCTYALEVPGTDLSFGAGTVARLVYRDGGLHKVVLLDKVGKREKPTSAPLHALLTFYTGCWLAWCHTPGASLVFDLWGSDNALNADVRAFVHEHLLPGRLFPETKCLRALGLSGLAAHVQLDRAKLRLVAKLARNSVEIIETDYLPWLRHNRGSLPRPVASHLEPLLLQDPGPGPGVYTTVATFLRTRYGLDDPPHPPNPPPNPPDPPDLGPVATAVDGATYRAVAAGAPLPRCPVDGCGLQLLCTHVDVGGMVWSVCACGALYRLDGRETVPPLVNIDVAMGAVTLRAGAARRYDIRAGVDPLPGCVDCGAALAPGRDGEAACACGATYTGVAPARELTVRVARRPALPHSAPAPRLPVIRPGRFTVYLGVDCSPNGNALCLLTYAGIHLRRVWIAYWAAVALPDTDPVHRCGGQDVHFTFTQYPGDGNVLRSMDTALRTLRVQLSAETVAAAVEEPLKVSRKHTAAQREHTLAVHALVDAHFPGTVFVSNTRAQSTWLRYGPGLAARPAASPAHTYSRHVPPLGLGRAWKKFLQYAVWAEDGFPSLLARGEAVVGETWGARAQLAATLRRALYKFTTHPVSDVVDATAVALHLRALDGFGPG
jgi:hypothetical protein